MSFFSAFRTPTNVEDEQNMTESQTSTGSQVVDQEQIDSQVAPCEPLPELPQVPIVKDTLVSDLEERINELEDKNKDLVKINKSMRRQESRDIDEIDYLKLEKKYLKKRNVELSNDRKMLKGIIKTLRSTIKTQNDQLDSWVDYYENYDYSFKNTQEDEEEYAITPPSSYSEEENLYTEASVYPEPESYFCDIVPSEQEFIDGALNVDQGIDTPFNYEGAGDSA